MRTFASHVFQQHGLRNRRAIVHPRTAVTMPACPDLEVKRTVYTIFFRAEDRS